MSDKKPEQTTPKRALSLKAYDAKRKVDPKDDPAK